MVNSQKIYILEKCHSIVIFMLKPLGEFFKLLIVRIKLMRIRGECMERGKLRKMV